MEIRVKSIEGLPYDMRTIFKTKPVLSIGDSVLEVLPFTAQAGYVVKLTDESGTSVEMRVRKLEHIPKPVA